MEFHKMLALSTGHLTQETRELLDDAVQGLILTEDQAPVTYEKREYGWFVHVPEKTEDLPGDCPTDLEACLHLAHSQGCGWIMFDIDVEPIEQLPFFKD